MLSRILVADPKKRITIPEIQRHPWYLKDLPPGVVDMNDNLPPPSSNAQVCSSIDKEWRYGAFRAATTSGSGNTSSRSGRRNSLGHGGVVQLRRRPSCLRASVFARNIWGRVRCSQSRTSQGLCARRSKRRRDRLAGTMTSIWTKRWIRRTSRRSTSGVSARVYEGASRDLPESPSTREQPPRRLAPER